MKKLFAESGDVILVVAVIVAIIGLATAALVRGGIVDNLIFTTLFSRLSDLATVPIS